MRAGAVQPFSSAYHPAGKRHGSVRGQKRSSTQLGLLSRLTREPDGIAPATERSFVFVYNDKTLTCADCGQEFVFTASEQDFYAQRGFTEPRRCASCRASRKAARTPRRRQGRTEPRRRRRLLGRRRRRAATAAVAVPRSRPARDVLGHLLELRQRSPGPVPPDQRQARLLQRLLPEHARRLTSSSRRGPIQRPAEPATPSTQVVPADLGRSIGRRGGPGQVDPRRRRRPAAQQVPRSNLRRSVPWSSRSMLSAWASQMSAAPTAVYITYGSGVSGTTSSRSSRPGTRGRAQQRPSDT